MFWKNSQGSIGILFGLAAPVLLLVGGYAIDYAGQVKVKADVQSLADGAAIAAAREIAMVNASPTQVQQVAFNFATTKARLSRKSMAAGTTLAVKAAVVDDFTGVTVKITKTWKSLFGKALGIEQLSASATSTAHIVGDTKICVVGLMDGGLLAGVHLDNKARLTAEGCGVYSNSPGLVSIQADNGSELTAELICAAGGASSTDSVSFTPEPITDCPQIPDPLAERTPPPVDTCLETGLVVETDTILSPGTYCEGLTIQGSASVKLNPGVYVIKDGPFIVDGQASVFGEFVNFTMLGDKSVFSFTESTVISLGAPKDGPMAGLLFFEAPTATQSSNETTESSFSTALTGAFTDAATFARVHRIRSDNARQLLGTIYLPNSVLQIDAKAPVADESAYTAIVVKRLWLLEGPHLVLNTNYAATEVPIPSSMAGADVRLTK